MCLLVFYINPNPDPDGFYLILINVRDETYDRPTRLASFWEKQSQVIGGMDMEPGREGGSWLAMNKNGKIGTLLNILQPADEILPNKKGRGFLAVDFVTGEQDSAGYLNDIYTKKSDYNGFLLLTLDLRSPQLPSIAYFTNATHIPPVYLEPGIHTFGNSLNPNEPWRKAVKTKDKFTEVMKLYGIVSEKDTLVKELFMLLRDPTPTGIDQNMEKQGRCLSKTFLEKLSSIFVQIPESNYGSRCHTVILIDKNGTVDYYEKSRQESSPPSADEPWIESHHTFKLNS